MTKKTWLETNFPLEEMQYEHPGVWLEIALDANKLSQKEFAQLIWKTAVEVNQIINGKRNITLDRAMRITAVFGGNPKYWLDMQTDYDQQEYKKSDKYPQVLQIQEKAKTLTLA